MILGIQLKPGAKGGKPLPTVFYCGLDAVQMRAAHAEMLKNNADGSASFFSVTNPIMVPLQRVIASAEDHPDHIAAQKIRAELAGKSEKKAVQPPLSGNEFVESELGNKDKGELFAIVQTLAAAGRLTAPEKNTKSALIEAILNAKPLQEIAV